jgi:hypothetical protein
MLYQEGIRFQDTHFFAAAEGGAPPSERPLLCLNDRKTFSLRCWGVWHVPACHKLRETENKCGVAINF